MGQRFPQLLFLIFYFDLLASRSYLDIDVRRQRPTRWRHHSKYLQPPIRFCDHSCNSLRLRALAWGVMAVPWPNLQKILQKDPSSREILRGSLRRPCLRGSYQGPSYLDVPFERMTSPLGNTPAWRHRDHVTWILRIRFRILSHEIWLIQVTAATFDSIVTDGGEFVTRPPMSRRRGKSGVVDVVNSVDVTHQSINRRCF